MTRRYYDWQRTFSYQTGEQGEICIVVGAKNIGKTFGLRKQCVQDWIKRKSRFCEICRTKEELKMVRQGYFDKLQNAGLFKEYVFRVEGSIGYIAEDPERLENLDYDEDGNPKSPDKPDWQPICYFVALSNFQMEKKRTYANVKRFIFDEAIIDRKDRYHRYLKNEFLVFANLLDSISRQQPGGEQYRVYILGNACDLTAPYMRYLGVNKIPEFGYSFWKGKHVLLDYVEPWDKEEMQERTLVGRMLEGTTESDMVYGNEFTDTGSGEVERKTSRAKFVYGLKYSDNVYAIWIDYSTGLVYVTSRTPKDAKNVIAMTKADSTIDYQAVERSSPYLQMLSKSFYNGALRYESPALRDMFLTVLDFLGVR